MPDTKESTSPSATPKTNDKENNTMIKPKDLDIPIEDQMTIAELMHEHGYGGLKKTQSFAFNEGILDDGNDLLIAETGNGKTLTAESITLKELEKGNRVAYLVPSRQLVWAKKNTISEWASPEYSVFTGEGKYQHADVAVATFESFYQAIIKGTEGALSIDAIVLDDFHEIYSDFRGASIELSITAALHEDISLYGISATIGNAKEIGDWMDANTLISPEDRQTPIKEFSVDSSTNSTKQKVIDVAEENQDKAPFLVFCFAKSWTESRAAALADADIFEGPSRDINLRNELASRVDGILTSTHRELLDMMQSGVAYIHSDLPGSIKQYILELYEEGELQAITTTTSLAYGFDSPVQTVIVADIKRRGNYVGVFEYIQWAGRAARPRFDYPCGYCYTLGDDTEEIEEKFFSPDRELEDVTTHIDNEQKFRWLILELIENDWETTEQIESFIKKSLYWEQMSPDAGWGMEEPKSKEEVLEERLIETTDWLIDNGFIVENDTLASFETTKLGQGAVNFHYNSCVDTDLLNIKSFYQWANETDQDEITQLDYLYETINDFELEMNASEANGRLEPILREYGYNTNKVSTTAGLIRWYWMRNYSTERIEQETDIDPTYIPSLASTLSDTVDATKYILEAAPNAREQKWHDNLVYRIEKGVRQDATPIVEDVDSMGRARTRFLRKYLKQMARQTLDAEPNTHMWALLEEFHYHTGNDDQFETILCENVDMIGEVTAQNLTHFIKNNDLTASPSTTKEETALAERKNEKTVTDEDLLGGDTGSSGGSGSGRSTSLRDF